MKTRLALVAASFLLAPALFAQTTFQVEVVTNTSHPDPGANSVVYAVDGVQGAVLTLIRGETYIFQMNSVPSIHPFFISTSSTGGDGGASAWTDGVTGNGATGNAMLTFVVPNGAPDDLYYQCQNHGIMGWELNIIDPVSIEDDVPQLNFDLSVAYPNPSRQAVTVGLSLDESSEVSVEVFDTAGRRVAVLHEGMLPAGTNHQFVFGDSELPAGVYLVRASSGGASVERTVTLVR